MPTKNKVLEITQIMFYQTEGTKRIMVGSTAESYYAQLTISRKSIDKVISIEQQMDLITCILKKKKNSQYITRRALR